MQIPTHQTLSRIMVRMFIPWYVMDMPLTIIRSYQRYAWAFWEIFSFPFLLSTLVSPWKNLLDTYPKNAFDMWGNFESFVMNMMSRMIGFLFRVMMIVLGIATHILCFTGFALFLSLWIVFPLLVLPGGLWYVFQSLIV